MKKEHHYKTKTIWKGNRGKGTFNYTSYDREHIIRVENKIDIIGSSDPNFRGDNTKHNPEEFLVSSVSSCHMLWYLHLCSSEGIIVLNYEDEAFGTMVENENGSGYFSEIILNPLVTVSKETMAQRAILLHEEANKYCFIANSLNFPIRHNVKINVLN